MAKITRKTQKIYGSSAGATGIAEYGSPATGTPAYSTDLDDIQTTAWETGWSAAALAGSEIPTFQDFNAIHYVFANQIGYLLQEGVPEYDAGTTYYINSIVKKAGTYELYGSKVIDNVGNALPSATDDSNWQYLGDLADLVDAGSAVDATTTVKGVVEIATDAEVLAETATGGTGASLTPTPATMKSHNGVSKAWVNFNGTGTVAIRDSYNVSSITDNSTGNYTVNLGVTMANTDYSVVVSRLMTQGIIGISNLTTTSFVIECDDTAGDPEDTSIVTAQVFGELA